MNEYVLLNGPEPDPILSPEMYADEEERQKAIAEMRAAGQLPSPTTVDSSSTFGVLMVAATEGQVIVDGFADKASAAADAETRAYWSARMAGANEVVAMLIRRAQAAGGAEV